MLSFLPLAEDARTRPERIQAARKEVALRRRDKRALERLEEEANRRGDILQAIHYRHGLGYPAFMAVVEAQGQLWDLENRPVPAAFVVGPDELQRRPVISLRRLRSALNMHRESFHKLCAAGKLTVLIVLPKTGRRPFHYVPQEEADKLIEQYNAPEVRERRLRHAGQLPEQRATRGQHLPPCPHCGGPSHRCGSYGEFRYYRCKSCRKKFRLEPLKERRYGTRYRCPYCGDESDQHYQYTDRETHRRRIYCRKCDVKYFVPNPASKSLKRT